jgi:hypothetical protein
MHGRRRLRRLTGHQCINLRLPTLGGFYPWELKKGNREVQVRVDGQLEDWCPVFPGLHACYATRREFSKAMTVVIDAIRYRNDESMT